MSDKPMARAEMGRREFIGVSAAVAVAVPASLIGGPVAARWVEPRTAAPAPLDDWSIDDMWAVYPRNAEAIAYGRAREQTVATVAAVDQFFIP